MLLLAFLATSLLTAANPENHAISEDQWAQLKNGEAVVISGPKGKERKALAAIIVSHSPPAIWEVIDDKESATEWVEGLRDAKVTEVGEGYSLIFQELKVCFFPGTFKYVIRHTETTPLRRIDFRRESGHFKSLEGFWELHPLEDGSKTLVYYQLKIEPGIPIPAMVIRDSMEKTLPQALIDLRSYVDLAEASNGASKLD